MKLPRMITVGTRMLSPVISVTTAAISQVTSPPASSSFHSRVGRCTKCSMRRSRRRAAGPRPYGRDRASACWPRHVYRARRPPLRCGPLRRAHGALDPSCGGDDGGRLLTGSAAAGHRAGEEARRGPSEPCSSSRAARSSIEPLAGTTKPATAEIPKKMQPSRFTAGSHHPARRVRGASRGASRRRRRSRPRPGSRSSRTRRAPDEPVVVRVRERVCIAANVVTLKNSVPADCTAAAHIPAAARPATARSAVLRRR